MGMPNLRAAFSPGRTDRIRRCDKWDVLASLASLALGIPQDLLKGEVPLEQIWEFLAPLLENLSRASDNAIPVAPDRVP